MTTFQRAVLVLAIAALVIAAWMLRYSIVEGQRLPFVLDRWTGKVRIATLE